MLQSTFKTLPVLLILIAWTGACAERVPPEAKFEKITPEAVAIKTGHIRPHSLRYTKAGNIMNYSVVPAKLDGAEALLVSIDFNQGPDSKPDQIWIDAESHAFRRRLLQLSAYTIDVNLKSGKFSGALTPTAESDYTAVDYNKSYPHALFEPAIINYAISALPLQLGYTASIPVLDLNDGSQMFWSNIRVLDDPIIKIEGTSFDTWKVESDGIRKKTVWIDKATGLAVKMKTKGNMGSWKIDPASIEVK